MKILVRHHVQCVALAYPSADGIFKCPRNLLPLLVEDKRGGVVCFMANEKLRGRILFHNHKSWSTLFVLMLVGDNLPSVTQSPHYQLLQASGHFAEPATESHHLLHQFVLTVSR